jgi:basic membrane protein A
MYWWSENIIAELPNLEATSKNAKVCVVLDGRENDKSFNEFTFRGAREAAESAGLTFAFTTTDFERNIQIFIIEGCDLIITVGYQMLDATAMAAITNPDVHFVTVDFEYFPGAGCDAGVADCYTEEGGLANVTSLVFAEDEAGYLAGTIAACMTETNVIGTVSGMEIPPVVKFVTGYQTAAKATNPDIETLNIYVPDFDDPNTGKQAGQMQIEQGADVIFGVGGNTGNGGLLAAHEAGVMAIGVDVDQYSTYPEIASSLLTSAMKNMEVAARQAVEAFANGQLEPGIRLGTVANDGVGLAPYHDWEDRIPIECKTAVDTATEGLANGTIDTGFSQ